MKSAAIYKRRDTLGVATMSQLYSGAWAMESHVETLNAEKTLEIVAACRAALDRSRSNLSESDLDWKNLRIPASQGAQAAIHQGASCRVRSGDGDVGA